MNWGWARSQIRDKKAIEERSDTIQEQCDTIQERYNTIQGRLHAKNDKTFGTADIPKDRNDLSEVVTDELMLPGKILETVSGRKVIKLVFYDCIRVSIKFPKANKVTISGQKKHGAPVNSDVTASNEEL
jgi:hypothetical protein